MAFLFPHLNEEQCSQFARLGALLLEANQRHNLTGARDLDELYLRHFADALTPLLYEEIETLRRAELALLDIGSGAGLPALALALARPQWRVTSLEATGKKVAFQREMVAALGLTRTQVVPGRAEEWAHEPDYRERFDVVTARAVAALRIVAELGLPFVKPGGILLAWKGPEAEREVEQASYALDVLQGEPEQIIRYDLAEAAGRMGLAKAESYPVFHLVVVRKTAPLRERKYPRSFKMIKGSPL